MSISLIRPPLEPAAREPGTTCTAMSDILNRIGDKWSVMVVARRAVEGISQRMLTLTLRNLERDGLVSRTIYAEVPPRVEYELTGLGQTLLEPIKALWEWADTHGEDVARARERYDNAAAE